MITREQIKSAENVILIVNYTPSYSTIYAKTNYVGYRPAIVFQDKIMYSKGGGAYELICEMSRVYNILIIHIKPFENAKTLIAFMRDYEAFVKEIDIKFKFERESNELISMKISGIYYD